MNLDIKRRIDAIDNPKAIQLFFNLINTLIKENQISAEDERFTLNVRNDYRKRFSVNINSRLVLYIKDGQEFGFMINQEDWFYFENIPFIKKELFEKYTPASFLVSFSLNIVLENKELIVKYWLKSCKEYLPAQQKSQYRKHHIQELYQMATDSSLLKEYFEKSDETYTSFQQIIYDFKEFIKSENSPLIDFEIQKVNKKYVWISDASKIIGKSGFCHYELITRDKYPNTIWIELHFDKSLKKEMKKYINHLLDDNFFWNSDHGIELSLALKENVNFNDVELFFKMEQGIAKIEERFGKTIRDFYKEKYTDMENSDNKKNFPLNQILYGPPGTGKTYNTINKALQIIENKSLEELKAEGRDSLKKRFDQYSKDGQIMFTTFHQSMSYEDFIEGIKPLKPEMDDAFVKYDIVPGIFKSICSKAIKREIKKDNFENVYYKLLDDIDNSANKNLILETLVHSKEFTIYKNSKNNLRFHANTEKAYEGVIRKDYIEHYLKTGEAIDWPSYTKAVGQYIIEQYNYSKTEEEHKIIPHVLIIDEINRGNVSQIFGELITLIEEDKRLGKNEALEVILPYSKEKFGVPANLYIIGTMNTADRSVEALDTALRRRFSFVEMMPDKNIFDTLNISDADLRKEVMLKINQRIEVLLDRNYVLGHSYFIKENFKNSFENEIIPMLQEYFYNDYGKIGLVLGKGFVSEKSITAKNDKSIFADFETKNEVDIIKTYELIPFSEVDFNTAIQTLLA